MKSVFAVIVFMSAPAFGTTNQLDFFWGRGSPLSSIQAQGSNERDGLRGGFWFFDALHHVSDRLYVGMGIGRFTASDNHSPSFVVGADSAISSRKTSTLILGRVDLGAASHFVPYAIAGAGWVNNSLTVTSDQGTLIDQSKATLGYTGGLGMDLMISDRLLLGIEARFEGSPAQNFSMTSTGAAVTGRSDVRTSLNLFLVGIKAGVKY